jgi:hypothetical protein
MFPWSCAILVARIKSEESQAFQGQFTLPLAYQGVSKFAWQTVGNYQPVDVPGSCAMTVISGR